MKIATYTARERWLLWTANTNKSIVIIMLIIMETTQPNGLEWHWWENNYAGTFLHFILYFRILQLFSKINFPVFILLWNQVVFKTI